MVALAVTLTPGPTTATIIRMTIRDGRAAARLTMLGNCLGVLVWGALSALGVSALIVASQLAYEVLRLGGALVLVVLGIRTFVSRHQLDVRVEGDETSPRRARSGWRVGLVTGVTNPKLAVFFVALFPQFLVRGAPVLPYAMAMAGVIVAIDVLWYSFLIHLVDRARNFFSSRAQHIMERLSGTVMVAFGVRLASEAR